ncbi:MAG TPA: ABC transporter permease, partial [Anaerolineales bacterium]|nr:ABC transporter permease [Anaerolineales bacterium]HNE02899.1 ABC transporter permease [Anaerolineales bacterium]HNH25389.1 ABC transporter permease [Anaerolineales bacterium]
MSVVAPAASEQTAPKRKTALHALSRMLRYIAMRVLTLFTTVVIGVYLTILIANMGGYVDQIIRGQIRDTITQSVANNPTLRNMDPETRRKLIEEQITLEEKRRGLDTPIAIRNFRHLTQALQLDLGRAFNITSDSGSKQVRLILLERLPATLLLMGTSQLFLFFSSIYIALNLSRNYGNIWDKLVIALSPTSAIPSWFYGIFLILIFAAGFKVLPFGGMVSSPPPLNRFDYIISVLQHLVLPGGALVISSFFLSVYNYRTFFLIYSSEDYVDMARAKGLHAKDIERR